MPVNARFASIHRGTFVSEPGQARFYHPAEERINIMSHAFGLLLSVVGLVLLVARAVSYGEVIHIVTFSVFGMSLVILYAASTWYHSTRDPVSRMRLRVVDHAAIYVLIAGTYTPFSLITLGGSLGWTIFSISWTMAVTGIVLKLFFTGQYHLLSTAMYVVMGWLIVFVIKPLVANLSTDGLYWLFAGGLAYTVGAVLYSIHRLHFNHAIFHLFVLAGSFSHWLAVYRYVGPAA
jgi:hemolysin III